MRKKEDPKALRRLTRMLIISGTANVALLGLLGYYLVKESPPVPYCSLKPTDSEMLALAPPSRTCCEVVAEDKLLPLPQLIGKLFDKREIEKGYTHRDLALATLVATHHFDINRALAHYPTPSATCRLIIETDDNALAAELPVYTGLTDLQFQAIIRFARCEKYPFTPEGLFARLQTTNDPSLTEAFCHTPQFLAAELLVSRSNRPLSRDDLLAILLQGDWSLLATFTQEQQLSHDLSPQRAEAFLSQYLALGATLPEPEIPKILYTVQEGDSLWKIAHRHHVTIGDIKSLNALPSDTLRPNMILEIPR